MKQLVLCIILITALIGPVVEAFFLGPIAVGVGLGALAFKKGLLLGSVLGRSRTNVRGGRSYTRYSRTNHYSQTNGYYSHYTQPRTVFLNVKPVRIIVDRHFLYSTITHPKVTTTEARGRYQTTPRRS